MIPVDDQRIQKYRTPFRYPKPVLHGSGVEGAFDEKSVDIPFVFWHNGKYYMVYSGFDGIGYQSALAQSNDLLQWEFVTMFLKRDLQSERWDKNGGAVTWIIKESDNLWDRPRLKKVEGKYWLIYHSYPGNGYEEGAAEIGMAWSEDETLREWHFLDTPVYSWKNGQAWEAGGLYKACIIENQGKWYMFYNAKTKDEHWIEQTGMAISEDLLHWERCSENPILKVDSGRWDQTFVSDPYVVQDEEKWICFYYGIGGIDKSDGLYHAEEGLALSDDLIHWEKVDEPILKHGPFGAFDNHHAHKPAMVYENGILYHFYCGTCQESSEFPTRLFGEYRTICVAASKPFLNEKYISNWELDNEKDGISKGEGYMGKRQSGRKEL